MERLPTYPTFKSLNKKLYLGGFAPLHILMIAGVCFMFFGMMVVFGVQYLSLIVFPFIFWGGRKFNKAQRNSKDDLIDTYFIFAATPDYIEDTNKCMSLLKKKTSK